MPGLRPPTGRSGLTEASTTIEIEAGSAPEALAAAADRLGARADDLCVVASRAPFALPWKKKRTFFTVGMKPVPVVSLPPIPPDGSWSLSFERGAIWLTVSPPNTPQGRPVATEEILSDIPNWPIGSVDEGILRRIVQRASGEPDVVGHLTFPAEEAPSYLVVTSPNEMAAYLLLGEPPKKAPSARTLLTALKKSGVVTGVDRVAVQNGLANWEPLSAVRVATGRRPTDGHDASLLEVFADGQQAGPPLEVVVERSVFFRTRLA